MPSRTSDPSDRVQIARDRQLARQVCRGDEQAVKSFCDCYLPRLYRFALSRLRSEQDADDVVQRVLANAARRMETYRGDAPLLGWLYQICRREIAKHLNAAARDANIVHFQQDESIAEVVEATTAPAGDEPEAASGQQEFEARVHMALDRLPPHYAKALEMKYLEGFSTKEIAQQMELADVAVQSLLARARRAFRTLCEGGQFGLEPSRDDES